MNELTIQDAKAQKNLQEWSQCVAECRSSGIPVSWWCAEHGINPKTYYRWQKKVFEAMDKQQERQTESPEGPTCRFAELPTPQTSHGLAATVRFGGATLEVYNGASAEIAAALCEALRHAQ